MPATLTKVLTESGEDEGRTTPVPKFLVTIDTSKTTEDYAKLDTIVLATKQGLVVPDKDAGVRFIPYQRNIVVTDVKVNDLFARLDTVANAFSKIGKVAGFGLLLIIPFIIAAAMLAMWMFIALPIALVALCIAALMKRSWTYSEMYKACLYGATTVILLRLLFDWLPGTPHVPATLLLLWMIVVVSLSKKKRESK